MPLVGANILILEAGPVVGVITDEEGIFMIENVPVGRYNILFSYIGYESFIMQDVSCGTGKEVFLDVGLKESVMELDEVTVEANTSKDQTINPMAGVSARSFTVEETEKYAGSWGDPARMASNYAGIFTNSDRYNYLVARGNSPFGMAWRLEGIPIPNPNHFDLPGASGGPICMLNNNQLTRSDFLMSAFPAEYGNCISGVFDLRFRNGNYEKREYLAQVGSNGLEFGTEGPFSNKDKSSYLINYRYSMLGLINKLLWTEGIPKYHDLSLKLNFPGKKGSLSVFGLGGTSQISFIKDVRSPSFLGQKRGVRERSAAKTGIVGVKYVHFLDQNTRITNHLAISTRRPEVRHDSVVDSEVSRLIGKQDYIENRFLFSSKLFKKFNAKNSLNAGLTLEDHFVYRNIEDEFIIYKLPARDSLVLLPPIKIRQKNLIVFQCFTEWKHQFTDKLSVYAGLNYTQFSINHSSSLEPRTNLKWELTDKQTINIGYGLHSQLQPLYYYFTRTSLTDDIWDRDQYVETNRELGFSKSHHIALAYDLLISRNLRFKAETYYQYLFNIPVEVNESYFSLLNMWGDSHAWEVDSLVNEGTGRNTGIDITFEKFLSDNYYFLFTASILDSKYKGSDGVKRHTAFNNNYMVNSLVGYELPVKDRSSININVRLALTGGRRIIPHDELKTLEERDDIYLYDRAYEERLKDYFRLDTRIGYKMNFKKATHELAVDIVNITNRANEFERVFDEATNRIETHYQQGFFITGFYRVNF